MSDISKVLESYFLKAFDRCNDAAIKGFLMSKQ
ncbi:hypothetical protein LEP3755_30580 [Leptolyngbya sp. NIES-3755]|nr:hypothetical protein LEP3755_30580 [Leptolyngbya sp. NIES-3755]